MAPLKVNLFALALQVGSAVDQAGNLKPGEAETLPSIHITDKGTHVDIAITISRDADTSQGPTHLPSSKG